MFDLQAFNERREAAQAEFQHWDCSAEKLKAAYAAGVRDFRRANLTGVDLRGANLRMANLQGANLHMAYLHMAYLQGANLQGANLQGANLREAYLQGANLHMAYLHMAYLQGANLTGVDLRGANLTGAYLREANLLKAPGIYSAFGVDMSSRIDTLHGGVVLDEGVIALRFWVGCKECVTADWLRERVKKEHAGKPHETQYMAAITFIEACFESDMQAKRWDYLLNWQPVKKESEATK